MWAFSETFDWIVLHRIRLMQLSVSYYRAAAAELDSTEQAVESVISSVVSLVAERGGLRADDEVAKGHVRTAAQQILQVRRQGMNAAMSQLARDLSQLVEYEGAFYAAVLSNTGKSINGASLAPIEVDIMGSSLVEWGTRLLSNDTRRLKDGLAFELNSGGSLSGLRARLLGTNGYNGRGSPVSMTRNELETLVYTAISVYTDSARVDINTRSPFRHKEVYTAILDSHTTEQCSSLHGQVFGSDEGPRAPLHWRCRSVRVPLVDGHRVRLPGFVKWVGRLSGANQDEVLGAKRGRAFRDNKLTLSTFSEPRWHGLSLPTLAKREARVFEDAGMSVPYR